MVKSAGYTLVELLIVLAVAGAIALIAFYGIRSYDQSDRVVKAQKDFLTQLRGVENKVNTGGSGQNTLRVTEADISLPRGVSVSPASFTICFNNPNLTSSTCTNNPAFPITITFSNGSVSRSVRIEGSGLFVTRVYAP